MRKQPLKLAFTATIMLALAFTFSCSSGGSGGGDDHNGGLSSPSGGGSPVTGGADGGGNSFSQIYNNSDGTPYTGSGVIKIYINNDVLINAGSVTNGIVNLKLPTIPDEYLAELCDYQRYSCNVNPNDIKGVGGDDKFVLYSNSGERISKLRIWDEQKSNAIMYWYVSKAGKIICNGEGKTINVDVKEAGWNKIYANGIIKYTTDSVLTKEVRWTLQ